MSSIEEVLSEPLQCPVCGASFHIEDYHFNVNSGRDLSVSFSFVLHKTLVEGQFRYGHPLGPDHDTAGAPLRWHRELLSLSISNQFNSTLTGDIVPVFRSALDCSVGLNEVYSILDRVVNKLNVHCRTVDLPKGREYEFPQATPPTRARTEEISFLNETVTVQVPEEIPPPLSLMELFNSMSPEGSTLMREEYAQGQNIYEPAPSTERPKQENKKPKKAKAEPIKLNETNPDEIITRRRYKLGAGESGDNKHS